MSSSTAYSNVQVFKAVTAESIEHCHLIFSPQRELFTVFIESIITTFNIRELFTVKGLEILTGDNYLNNEIMRSFILTIDSVFFANLGDRHGLRNQLVEIIIESLSINGMNAPLDPNKCLIPEDYLERIASADQISETLNNNRWIIPIIAILFWGKPLYKLQETAKLGVVATKVQDD